MVPVTDWETLVCRFFMWEIARKVSDLFLSKVTHLESNRFISYFHADTQDMYIELARKYVQLAFRKHFHRQVTG